MLDERLSLAAALYQPCELGADIGTDHALLPCHLLEQGICDRMILADVSPKALQHARDQVSRRKLEDRAILRCADGLDALDRPCGCVSAMGMGGGTLAGILRHGKQKLHGAVLVLSVHTEPHLARQAICDIGYHIVREELCLAAGRYYVFWRAEPGFAPMTGDQIRYGSLLYQSGSPLLRGWLMWRIGVTQARLSGLRTAGSPDEAAISDAARDLTFYQSQLEVLAQ